MKEPLICRICGSSNTVRLDGSGTSQKAARDKQIIDLDISPEHARCKACGAVFSAPLAADIPPDEI